MCCSEEEREAASQQYNGHKPQDISVSSSKNSLLYFTMISLVTWDCTPPYWVVGPAWLGVLSILYLWRVYHLPRDDSADAHVQGGHDSISQVVHP